MEFKFDEATLQMIQELAYPIILKFTGFDPSEWVGTQSELFIKIGDGFNDLAAFFIVIGTALEDGILTMEEILEIVEKAVSLPEAIDNVVDFFETDEDEPTPVTTDGV